MMSGLVEDFGMFRNREEGVFDGDKVIFVAPPQEKVSELINNLFDYINKDEENILIKSCVFHYEFEFIHPFSDGNGRMGRMWQTCLLASKESLFAYLPIETIIKERQQEYYNAINTCNNVGNCDVFIEFMLDVIYKTMQRTIKREYKQSKLDIKIIRLLDVMDKGIEYSTKELLELLDMKSRVSFKKNYLDVAIELGVVKMTIPDVPKSKNQRYIKV